MLWTEAEDVRIRFTMYINTFQPTRERAFHADRAVRRIVCCRAHRGYSARQRHSLAAIQEDRLALPVKTAPAIRARAVSTGLNHGGTRGFTLVEMLLVIGVIFILMGLIIPAVTPLLRGTQITQGGDQVIAQMELARQLALTKNKTVEVRFCQPSGGSFTAIMTGFVGPGTTPTYTLSDKPALLPSGVILDGGNAGSTLTTLSTLLASSTQTVVDASKNNNNPNLGNSKKYNYVAFQFRPDGSTNLDVNSRWFVTVHNATDGDNLSKPPANYFTLQIDAYNGRVREFRP